MAEKKEAKTKEAKEPKVAKEAKETKSTVETKVVAEAKPVFQPRAAAPAREPMQGNFVYIGKKGVMAYVLAVITQFSQGAKDVIIKARGKSISRAVDVAEIVRNKSEEMKIVSIKTSTEEVQTEDGRPLKVSAIEITLTK